jgi:hypothetical protein
MISARRAVRTCRVLGTVLFETAAVVALVALGRRPELAVPTEHLGEWLREGDPATVVVALLRWIALIGAGWLLASTLLYVAASVSRVPAAMRAVRWSTLPAVRRAVDAACAVSVATSVALAPSVASAARVNDPPGVSAVRDGRGVAPVAAPAPASPVPASPEPAGPPAAPVAPVAPVVDAAEVVVAPGDNLWVLAARHLAAARGGPTSELSDGDVAPYWVRVCDANRERLTSGDPNLVFPGERVVLPPV